MSSTLTALHTISSCFYFIFSYVNLYTANSFPSLGLSSDAWIAIAFGSFGAIISLISLAIGNLTLRAAAVAKSELNCFSLNSLKLSRELKLT
jgi:hypothetical protein